MSDFTPQELRLLAASDRIDARGPRVYAKFSDPVAKERVRKSKVAYKHRKRQEKEHHAIS